MKIQRVMTTLLLFSLPFVAHAQNSQTRFGITVTNCQFDYDEENFCSTKRMRAFANIMKERRPNFANDLILYIYNSNHSVINGLHNSYRMVVINPKKRTVEPFYWAFNPADKPVNEKGEHLEFQFNVQSKRFCVKGNIEAYRDAYDYAEIDNKQGFCFPYTGKGYHAGFDWFEQ